MKRLTFGLALLAAAVVAVLTAAAAPGKPPAPSLTWSPTTHPFGQIVIGNTGSKEFTLTFAGKGTSGPLTVERGGSAWFSIPTATDNCSGVTLNARTPTCTVTVQYAPTIAGQSDTGTLYASSRKITNVTSATLSGTGQAATLPSLWINDAPWVFSNSPAVVTFTVTMEAPRASNVTFDWVATDDTAYWGTSCDGSADYTSAAMTGTGSITAGQTTTTIPFGACDNGPAHVPPITTPTYFFVTISNPSGATITTDTGKAEIRIS